MGRGETLHPPAPRSDDERELLAHFVEAFLADDVDGIVALVTENAWFRMPPADVEYQGPAQIGAMLRAIAARRVGQAPVLLPTRANGQPAYGTYRIDPVSGVAEPVGVLVLSLTGPRVAALTWFVGPAQLAAFGLPTDPSDPRLVSEAL